MMNELQQAIHTLLEKTEVHVLEKAAAALTARYKEGGSLDSENALLAYLIVRFPATYAALNYVISKISPGSILDIGAGPGTAWWSARATWNIHPHITAIEKQASFIALGKQLGAHVQWIQGDALAFKNFETHDWVFFSYSLGELPEKDLVSLLHKSWQAAQKGVVVVEPGTPKGYQRTLFARNTLLACGGNMLAPCPHANACPIQAPDWCHFSVRLERTCLHRRLKQATLPFEDEKFCYMIITKEKNNPCPSRIIRNPRYHSGHVILSLCTPAGLKNTTVARSQKETYKKARKSNWGDTSVLGVGDSVA